MDTILDQICDKLGNTNCWEAGDDEYYQLIRSHITSHPDMPAYKYDLITERYQRYLQNIGYWGEYEYLKKKVKKFLATSNLREKYNLSQEIDGEIIKFIDGFNDPRFIQVIENLK